MNGNHKDDFLFLLIPLKCLCLKGKVEDTMTPSWRVLQDFSRKEIFLIIGLQNLSDVFTDGITLHISK